VFEKFLGEPGAEKGDCGGEEEDIIVGDGVGSGYECKESEDCEVVGRETLNVMGDTIVGDS
jgi:hypothetical protein